MVKETKKHEIEENPNHNYKYPTPDIREAEKFKRVIRKKALFKKGITLRNRIEKCYFTGIDIDSKNLIDLDEYLKGYEEENIVFNLLVGKINKKNYIVEKIKCKIYPSPLVLNPRCPETKDRPTSSKFLEVKNKSRGIGFNYKITTWIEIEKRLLKDESIDILDSRAIDLYKKSFALAMGEINRSKYKNFYNHLEGFRDIRIGGYIYKGYTEDRIRKLVQHTLGIKRFIEDGIGYIGTLFAIQIDLVSDRYIWDVQTKKVILNMYESLFSEEIKKRFDKRKVIKNPYNPYLEIGLRGLKEYKEQKKTYNKKSLSIDKEVKDKDILGSKETEEIEDVNDLLDEILVYM